MPKDILNKVQKNVMHLRVKSVYFLSYIFINCNWSFLNIYSKTHSKHSLSIPVKMCTGIRTEFEPNNPGTVVSKIRKNLFILGERVF